MSAIVNPAAMMLPVGAAYALLALWARDRSAAWWALPVGAVAAMAVTAANLAGLAVVWLFLLVDRLWAMRKDVAQLHRDAEDAVGAGKHPAAAGSDPAALRRTAGIVGVSVVAALAAALVWSWIQATRVVVPFDQLPAAAVQMPADLDWTQALGPVLNFVTPQEFAPEGVGLGTSGPPIVQAIALVPACRPGRTSVDDGR